MSQWLSGVGYIQVWERLHRAEEAFLVNAPIARLMAEAKADVNRVTGSTIENREQLLLDARIAIEVLSVRAQMVVRPPALVPPLPPGAYTAADERFSRESLRQFRRAINEFRDDARMGLVRARNQLLRTVFVTSLVSYGLLALAILAGALPKQIFAATCFFLIGAVVGLFNRLYLDASAQTAVEDYGLAAARLVHTPIISGLAAVGAVLMIPMLSEVANGNTNVQALQEILFKTFDMNERPFGLVLAALFGLSPAMLISRLQQESEEFKTGLKSSEEASRQ